MFIFPGMVYFLLGVFLSISGCTHNDSQLLAEQALRMESLPRSARVIKSNGMSGLVTGIYEYYLEILAVDYPLLLQGRTWEPCARQSIGSHDAFSGFAQLPNVPLVHCVKSSDEQSGVAVYRDATSRMVFITFELK